MKSKKLSAWAGQMKLYGTLAPSGNVYKIRLFLAILKIPHHEVILDLREKRDQKKPEHLKLNPRGEVPVIEHNGNVIWDSAACLMYLARQPGAEAWLPTTAAPMAEVMQWLSLAGGEIQYGLQYARRFLRGFYPTADLAELQRIGKIALTTLESRLISHDWLAGKTPTIADIACYPYVYTAPEGQIPLDPYPGVNKWLKRFETIPGWQKPFMEPKK